jgi:hypothetical protein
MLTAVQESDVVQVQTEGKDEITELSPAALGLVGGGWSFDTVI